MIYRFLINCMLLGILPLTSFGQVKYEKEYRLDQGAVPAKAIEFVENLAFDKSVKWYKEEGLDHHSIEAKTKYLSRNYSIEFDQFGNLEDVEIEIQEKEIKPSLRKILDQYLSDHHDKVTICKTQLQLIESIGNIKDLISNQDFDLMMSNSNYELVVKVKDGPQFSRMEYLFDAKGNMLRRSKIIQKNTDNIEY